MKSLGTTQRSAAISRTTRISSRRRRFGTPGREGLNADLTPFPQEGEVLKRAQQTRQSERSRRSESRHIFRFAQLGDRIAHGQELHRHYVLVVQFHELAENVGVVNLAGAGLVAAGYVGYVDQA